MATNLDASAAVGTVYSAPMTIYDSLGASHVVLFTYTKTATNTWDYSVSIPAADVNGKVDPTVLQSGTLTFDGTGKLTTPSADITGIPITGFADGANDQTFNWKLFDANGGGFLTQLASPSGTSSTQQDGSGSGTLVKFDIGSDGTITGAFSNGKTAILGQLATATFANNQACCAPATTDSPKPSLPARQWSVAPEQAAAARWPVARSSSPTSISPRNLRR